MARQTINLGTGINTGTGDTLRAAMDKSNDNFEELYNSVFGTDSANPTIAASTITTEITNGSITLSPNGTGEVIVSADLVVQSGIRTDDSSVIEFHDAVKFNNTITVNEIQPVDSSSIQISNLDTDVISSSSSSAIQVNEGLNVSGTVTHNAATVYSVQDDLATSTTALSLTKTIHSLAGGESDYTLAAGTEGQIMHFVVAGGTSTANEIALTEITVSQVRNPRDGDVLATYVWRPFIAGTTDLGDSTVPQRTMASCIFANGAWNLDFFTKA